MVLKNNLHFQIPNLSRDFFAQLTTTCTTSGNGPQRPKLDLLLYLQFEAIQTAKLVFTLVAASKLTPAFPLDTRASAQV